MEFGQLLGRELQQVVIDLHGLLAPHYRHFGYRVANEIARFVVLAGEQSASTSEDLWAALDLAILQKVLPKFNGTRQDLEQPLANLFAYVCAGVLPDGNRRQAQYTDYAPMGEFLHRIADDGEEPPSTPRLPRSAAKIRRMLRRLQQGFTSYME